MTGLPPLFQAVLWFCGTMAGFAGMAIAARGLHTTMSTFEILFFRSLIGVLFVLPFLMRRRFADLRTTKLPLHLGRAAVQFGQQCFLAGRLGVRHHGIGAGQQISDFHNNTNGLAGTNSIRPAGGAPTQRASGRRR